MRLKLVNRYYYVLLVVGMAWGSIVAQDIHKDALLYKKIGLSGINLPFLPNGSHQAKPLDKVSYQKKVGQTKKSELYPNRDQIVTAGKTLCEQLIVCLETIEFYLAYWKSAQKRGDGFSRQIKKHISFLTSAQTYAASYLGALHTVLKQHATASSNDEAEKNRKFMLQLINDCLQLRPFNNSPEVASDFKKVSLRKTNCYSNYFVRHLQAHAPPGHFRRHWKKYLTSAIGLATLGVLAYKNQEILKKWANRGIKLFQENVSDPIWDLIKLPFEEQPDFPKLSSEPWIYKEQQGIFREDVKNYLELKNGIAVAKQISPDEDLSWTEVDSIADEENMTYEAKKIKGILDRLPLVGTIKELLHTKNMLEKAIPEGIKDFEKIRGKYGQIGRKPLTAEQEAYVDYIVQKGILGEIIAKDVAELSKNTYEKFLDGRLIALIELQIRQGVIVETARILKGVWDLIGFWMPKLHSLWKVLRVMALFSVIPATLILYKTYNAFKNKKIAAADPIKDLLRTIDRILTKYYNSSKTIEYADQGLVAYHIHKLRHLVGQLPTDHQEHFEEDLKDLATLHFCADQKHAVILRIYNTYPFLSMKC